MITLAGTLERITFQNPDNHYTIARIRPREASEAVTVVGHMAGVATGETLKLTGSWVTHPTYGEQFKVATFEVTLPASVAGIRQYLASGIIRGIGKSMAGRIVDHFHEDALDVIENEPERLLEVQGIGRAKADIIIRAWESHHAVRRVMQFLQGHDVGVFHASMILNTFGRDALHILKTDPYRVCRDVPEAGFEVADAIALKSGVAPDDPERIKACLVYAVAQAATDGHVCAQSSAVLQRCGQLTRAELPQIEAALESLIESGDLVMEEDLLFLKEFHRAETGIARRILAMQSVPVPDWGIGSEEITAEVLARLAVKLSDEQLHIVRQVLNHRVVVITGGPGTGKTTLIRALCAVFYRLRQKVILSAPTGRAARRISEVTGRKASTLHRLLLYDPETSAFNRNQVNPLEADVVIVDEASMVDTLLMHSLVQAVPVNAFLILVGDIFQLPSVGAGNVLSDIIRSQAVTVFFLTTIFRQAEKSPIVVNAHRIRHGEMPDLEKPDEGLSEFYFIENHSQDRVVATITELCSGRIKNAFSHIDEIQVLTPMHRGEAGTINLNQKLQAAINPGPDGIEARGFIFRPGDKVMHLKNNYQKDVFNGDIGFVDEVVKSEGRLTVNYDGRLVDYELLELDELTLAYAISVHKSQGSEYSAVVVALTTVHYPLLQRNLLYTALTRGRDLVILVGSRRAVEIALANNRTDTRLSRLCHRLTPDLESEADSKL